MTVASLMVPLMARLDDRLPPVLIKELRQALRAKAFLGSFVVALVLALIVAWNWSLDQGSNPDGARLASTLLTVMLLPAALLIPFGAFQSMSSEWERGTIEQLQLSTLSPISLAAGKLLSAMVQLLLFCCAFFPFVALASVAGGAGIGQLAYGLASVVGICFALTSWALVLGSFGKNRAGRTAMLVLLFIMGSWWIRLPLIVVFGAGWSAMTAATPGVAVAELIGLNLVPGVLGLAVAATRLAHPATNTSTPLRWTGTACLGAGILVATGLAYGAGMNQFEYGWTLAGLATLLAVGAIFFTTEPEALPRPVRARLAARRVELPFEGFWLPGGGRGVAWFWLHGALLIVLGSVLGAKLPPGFSRPANGIDVVTPAIAVLCLANFYVVLPGTLLMGWNRTRKRRVLVRWIPAVLAIGGPLFSLFTGILLGRNPDGDSVLDPSWVVGRVTRDGLDSGAGISVLVLGVGSMVLTLARPMAGMREARSLRRDAES